MGDSAPAVACWGQVSPDPDVEVEAKLGMGRTGVENHHRCVVFWRNKGSFRRHLTQTGIWATSIYPWFQVEFGPGRCFQIFQEMGVV